MKTLLQKAWEAVRNYFHRYEQSQPTPSVRSHYELQVTRSTDGKINFTELEPSEYGRSSTSPGEMTPLEKCDVETRRLIVAKIHASDEELLRKWRQQ